MSLTPSEIATRAAALGLDIILMEDGSVNLHVDVWTTTEEPQDEVWDELCCIERRLARAGLRLVNAEVDHDTIEGTVVEADPGREG